MTPKPRLKAVLCLVGIHGGPWAYVAEISCSQGRECRRCGAVHARTRHQREWQYSAADKCLQDRICVRCADVNKTRTKHEDWGPTYSIESETDAHECVRCGKVESWSTASDGD